MKKLFMIAALRSSACGMNAADPYKVQVPGTADLEKAQCYILVTMITAVCRLSAL